MSYIASTRPVSSLIRNLPLYTFAAFTLIGSIFIAVAKVSGVNPFVSMTVPILLMIGYLCLSLFSGRIRLHGEQTGDNLYYMGFLFTLSSLGVSLYQFTSAGSTDEVIRNFGIAITSTIFGIALRILYNQTRRDVLDIERATRHELADMTRRVRSELENASREFADFRRVSNQMISEGFDEIVRQADTTGVQLRESFEKMAAEAIKPVESASAKLGSAIDSSLGQIISRLSEIAQKVDNSGEAFERANSGVANSATQLGTQVDAVARKLEAVMVPEAVLKNELGPLVKELGRIVAEYGSKTEAASQEQAKRMDLITAAVARILEATSKSVQLMEKSVEASAQVQRSTDNLTRHIQEQNSDMQKFLEKMLAETRASAKPAHFEPLSSGMRAASGLDGANVAATARSDASPLFDGMASTAAPQSAAELVQPPVGGEGPVNVEIAVTDLHDTEQRRWWRRR